jgi:uncharacterized protein (TIGR02147 family)
MKKLICPEINRYDRLLSFLDDFYKLNKEKNGFFSFRYMAGKLKWSGSYLNDVFKGKKHFSLKRALEFVEFIELKGVRAERFLFLLLSDTSKDFAHSKVQSMVLMSRNSQAVRGTMTHEEFAKYQTLFDYYILFYIELNKGVWNVQDFLEKLTLPQKPPIVLINKAVKRLENIGQVIFDPKSKKYGLRETEDNSLIFDQNGKNTSIDEKAKLEAILKLERAYQINYLNYLENSIPRHRTFFSGVINLDEELYIEARDRIFSLRNYLYELDCRAQERYSSARGPSDRVWQFSINLFSLFEDPEKSDPDLQDQKS